MEYARAFRTKRGIRADVIVLEKLQEIAEAGGRYSSGYAIETGYDYENDCPIMIHKGGAMQGQRETTPRDVQNVRAQLGRVGVKISLADAEALLTEAYYVTDCASRAGLQATEDAIEAARLAKRERNRVTRKAQVARRRAALQCVNCGTYHGIAGRATCVGKCRAYKINQNP